MRKIHLLRKEAVIALFFFFSVQVPALCQTTTVTGIVREENGATMPGVNVIVAGTQLGVLTENDGSYSIKVPQGGVLQFTFVGYQPQSITVNSQSVVNVIMKEDIRNLGEVVIVGYGVTRKRDLASSISSIKVDETRAGVVANSAQLLKGRAAGVQVKLSSLEPGSGIYVRVRGASSISSNNEPLYVVDGFQTDEGNQINPGDIESMEILKDAAATAIYGARGANGVVIITTKKGIKDQFNVSYSYNMSVKNLYNPWDLMDAQDLMAYNMKLWKDNGSSGNAPYTDAQLEYKGEGTDWVKELTRTASTQTHQLNIAGGQDKITMALSANYIDDIGILENTKFNRFSGRLNMDYKFSKRVRFGANVFTARTTKNYLSMGTNSSMDNAIYQIFMMSPLTTPSGYDVFGDEGKKPSVYYEIFDKDMSIASNSSYATVYSEFDILKTLTARVQYTYNNDANKSQKYYTKSTILGSSYDGLATVENEKNDNQQFEALLTWHPKFNDKNDLKVIAGSTYINKVYEYSGIQAYGFTTDEFSYYNLGGAKTVDWISSARYDRTAESFFGRAEYVLNDKYIFNASLRADGSSNFGSGNKWGYFPSVSAAWQLGDEPFMDVIKPVVSSLKIRTSYGQSGNDGIGSYLSQTKFAMTDVFLGGSSIIKGMYPSNAGNPNLRWETTSQLDLGADFALLKGRIEVNFDYYIKTTTDLLNEINVSTSTGGFTTITGNNGTVQNKGWELFIKSNNITTDNFSWTSTFNISQNRNKVVHLNDGAPTYYSVRPHGSYNYQEYLMLQEGNSMSSLYGYVFDGLIQAGETYTPQPTSVEGEPKFRDLDNSGTIDSKDRKVIGNGYPDVIMGLNNTLRYKNFDLSFFIDASIGNEMLNLTRILLEDNDRLVESTDRWTKANASNAVPVNGWKKNAGIKYGSYINSRFVEDASYIRLSNIELGYTLPANIIKGVRSIHVFIGGQRLLTLTRYSGFDPDISTNGSNAVKQGLDFSSYPAYRMFNCGAKINF